LDLEREFATSTVQGMGFDCLEQSAADALATVSGYDRQIMNIEKRERLECRETKETHCHTNGSPFVECKKHQHSWMIPQRWNKAFLNIRAERFTTTQRIGCVGVEHFDDARTVQGIREVNFEDFQLHSHLRVILLDASHLDTLRCK